MGQRCWLGMAGVPAQAGQDTIIPRLFQRLMQAFWVERAGEPLFFRFTGRNLCFQAQTETPCPDP